MYKRYLAFATFFLVLLMTGCATTKMALQDESDTVPGKIKPIFLMTATLKNLYATFYQPELHSVNVEKKDTKDDSDRFNFAIDDKAKFVTGTPESGNSYFLRMELEKGEYVIRGLTGGSGIFPIRGSFFAPLHVDIKSNNTGVFYLGHVDATVRERKDGEFRAGAVFPLLNQSVMGFSGGTFEIEISDQYEIDMTDFKTRFPVLNGVTIQKAILPSFDRVKAQKWWEEN
ncbi:hypothetical protein [Candidatus Parabeggiatoa sp. HSG14]|uniref:hypothetical protein n=1 Tax=Candidatus Parabeggiatoa sp. HSG14 TaxID=3055593 RepID=UPI0025A6FB09|nr:hypothetical protein [Thiotrichales bacterium HSG14]